MQEVSAIYTTDKEIEEPITLASRMLFLSAKSRIKPGNSLTGEPLPAIAPQMGGMGLRLYIIRK